MTRLYPKTPYLPAAGTRGSIEIEYEKCNFCLLCDKRCPTGAIKVDRPGKVWEIDRLRCIICGYCVEVCPKDCLHLSPRYSAPIGGDAKPTSHEAHGPAAAAASVGAPSPSAGTRPGNVSVPKPSVNSVTGADAPRDGESPSAHGKE